MDDLEEFSIQYDISDREMMYDYVACREYRRPETGWDYSQFQTTHSGLDMLDDDDENAQLRVKLTDKAFCDQRVFEKYNQHEKDEDRAAKEARNEGNKHEAQYVWFENEADKANRLPRRMIPVYQGGDVVKGSLLLHSKSPIDAKHLTIGIQGRSFVSVRIYHKHGYSDCTADDKFVDEKTVFWEKSDSKSDSAEDEFALLSLGPGQISRSKFIPPGEHKFHFEFAMPVDAPQSTPAMVISTHNKGHNVYRIKATIGQDNLGGRGNLVVHRGLWVRKIVDIAQNPESLQAVEACEELETGIMKKGKISIQASMARSGVILGQPVKLQLDVNNQSNGEINKISAYIRMFGKARLKDGKMSCNNSIDIKSAKCKESVSAGETLQYKWELPWDFSQASIDGNLLPVGDLHDCKLLDIKYEIRIDVKRKGLHRDMHLNIPMFVGNKNTSQF